MGLFDNVNKETGQASFVQEAKWFATLDLNSIFKESGKAVLSIIGNALKFFQWMFGRTSFNDDQGLLGERMIDQIPGMALALVQAGLLDPSIGQYVLDHPGTASIVSRNAGKNKDIYALACSLFTVLFGVRITYNSDLDRLQKGVGDYYSVPNRDDIPKTAVQRAVMLKQTFFPDTMYNTQQWDMNKFQQYPLVSPVPGVDYGTLYTGDIVGGGFLQDGILVKGGSLVGQTEEEKTAAATTGGIPMWAYALLIGAGIYIYSEWE